MKIICVFSEVTFDAVVASEVIEHVDNPELFIKTISSLLKVNILECIYKGGGMTELIN